MNPVTLDIIELNTVDNPKPNFRDETPRIRCSKCGNYLLYGYGMVEWPPDGEQRRRGDRIRAITDYHLQSCGGDAAVTLMKIEQAYKSGEFKINT